MRRLPKLMLVASRSAEPRGGRALLSQLILHCLERLLGEDFVVYDLNVAETAGSSRMDAMLGYIDGVGRETIQRVVAAARAEGVQRILIDGSNRGLLAAAIREHLPDVEVLTFFHNVEARFFWGSLKRQRHPHAIGVLIANYLAERQAVNASHRLVALSARDSRELDRIYGRPATDILPLAMQDKFRPGEAPQRARGTSRYALFVGGAFYANEDGITWFVKNVVPHIRIRTCIVGQGMEGLRERLDHSEKVQVVGSVDDLQDWYLNADVVIAPIFDGSGMKTKVAEALMFGKQVLGTREAFAGYEDVESEAGSVCHTRDDFIAALRAIEAAAAPRFDQRLRSLYEQRYSAPAAMRRLAAILSRDAREV